MLSSKKIAVTGGLACGKTSVCHFLKELGAAVFSADQIVHHLLESDVRLQSEVVELLGEEVIANGKISREVIGKIVFGDREKLHALEALLHPAVEREIKALYKEATAPLFVVEIPLLFEAGFERLFDQTIAVICPPEVAKKRFSGDDYERRMERQHTIEEKQARADLVIENGGTLEDLKVATGTLYNTLLRKT